MIDFTDYRVSEHAIARLRDKFNIQRSDSKKWIEDLLDVSEFKTEDHNRKKYGTDQISIVLDTHSKIVITVFPESTGEKIVKHLNPEIKTVINRSVEEFIEKRQQHNRDQIKDEVHALGDIFDNDENIELIEFKKSLAELNEKIDKNDRIINEAYGVIEKGM